MPIHISTLTNDINIYFEKYVIIEIIIYRLAPFYGLKKIYQIYFDQEKNETLKIILDDRTVRLMLNGQ